MTKALYINLNNKEIYAGEFQEKDLNENDLVFATSKLVGYGIIGLNRVKVYCNSKETSCGGYFSHQLKCNGYEYIIIKGQSENPVYLYINKEEIYLNDAKTIWEKIPSVVRDTLYKELNDEDIEIAQIGVGSELGIDFSKILIGNNRTCGKNGIGKVMGEKKLKAIALRRQDTLEGKSKNYINEINKKIANTICSKELYYYFDNNNSCYGCCVNCESTSIKKIFKYISDLERCKKIDKICNDLVIDSITIAKHISENTNYEDNVDIEKYIRDIIYENKSSKSSINVEKKNKENQSKNILNKELEELGFCKFLVDKNILTRDELEKIKEITL